MPENGQEPEQHGQDEVIEQLEKLNEETAKSHSLKRQFLVGIVYGVGFVVGSAIIATMIIGLFGPLLSHPDRPRLF